MVTQAARSAEILRRFKCNDPLNLSAIEIECPWLLEGLFDPQDFVGWRESIEAAGIAIDQIKVEPQPLVRCLICGFEGDTLWNHLSNAHGTNSADYSEAYPGAETSSEAHRAARMANRHGRTAKMVMPHWEPAWSRNYALDRIHHFSKQGIPLNYSYLALHEPGFPAYVRRIFPSWDAGLAAAGINVAAVRQAREASCYSQEQLLEVLQNYERTSPGKLHIKASRNAYFKATITAAFRHYGSYEKALAAAGIDPLTKMPALADPVKLKARETLIREAEISCKKREAYNPVTSKKFIDKHSGTIKDFYGNWVNLFRSLKLAERELFQSPSYQIYDSPSRCIAGLQERARVGLRMHNDEVRVDNPSLEIMCSKHFTNFGEALKAAGIERLPHSYDLRDYADGKEVLAELKRRYEAGEPLYHSSLEFGGGRSLLKWSKRFFGTYNQALAAAGIPPFEKKVRKDFGIKKGPRTSTNQLSK